MNQEGAAGDDGRLVAAATEEAHRMGHDFVGTEHLLLGLLVLGAGTAYTSLTELEVTYDDVRRKVNERVHPYGSGSIESPPFTPLAEKVLERARRQGHRLGRPTLSSEHFLLGLVDVPDGGGARILVELAGSLEQVRLAVESCISAPPGPATARPETDDGPRCPGCRALVSGRVRYRTLVVPPAPTEPDGAPPRPATVVYCTHCGQTLGLA